MIECRCGCGGTFEPSRSLLWRLKKGKPVGFLRGHGQRGERNHRWKGGTTKTQHGYKLVIAPPDVPSRKNGYILEHRLVAGRTLGRPIGPHEIVHHRDGAITNNTPDNLEPMTRAEHVATHFAETGNPRQLPPLEPKTCPVCGTSFVKTSRDNHKRDTHCSRRCMQTTFWGEGAPNARLSDEDVAKIRRLGQTMPQRQIAKLMGCSKTQVGRLLRGECRPA